FVDELGDPTELGRVDPVDVEPLAVVAAGEVLQQPLDRLRLGRTRPRSGGGLRFFTRLAHRATTPWTTLESAVAGPRERAARLLAPRCRRSLRSGSSPGRREEGGRRSLRGCARSPPLRPRRACAPGRRPRPPGRGGELGN